jgi:hypothetical protein
MRNTLLVIFSLTIAILAAELGLRWLAPVHTVGIRNSYEYDAELGVKLRPSVHLFRLTDHLEEIRTNRFGVVDFRDDYSGYPALAFAIGDSFTQGTGLPPDESYPTKLDLILNRDSTGRYEKRIAVVNLGIGSFGGEQSLRALQRFAKTIGAPKYCLYLGSDNDFDDDVLFRSGSRHRQLVRGNPYWGPFVAPLAWISSLQIVLRAKLFLADRRLQNIRPASSGKSVPEMEWPVIEKIISTCEALGAKPILAWVPPGNMVSYSWIKNKAAKKGIAFNDWYPSERSTLAALPSLPERNPHSGDHYPGWISGLIAAGFGREIALQ